MRGGEEVRGCGVNSEGVDQIRVWREGGSGERMFLMDFPGPCQLPPS